MNYQLQGLRLARTIRTVLTLHSGIGLNAVAVRLFICGAGFPARRSGRLESLPHIDSSLRQQYWG